MSKTAFFSILIPTKNRSHLIGYAIQSVLDQSFDDFEIILVDNNDGEGNREAVEEYSDSRLKYFRTGNLNMSENWEYALNQANGKYITVLEDKQAYYPWALKKLYDAITKTGYDVIVWEWDIYQDQKMQASRAKHSRKAFHMETEDILAMYINKPAKAGRYMPRMLNSCAANDVIRKIKEHQNVDRFFSELSPDLCAAFYLLAFVDSLFFINDGLGLIGYNHLSNAIMGTRKGKAGEKYYGRIIVPKSVLHHVPIKSPRLAYNTVYNDFLRIRCQVGGKLSFCVMSPTAYARVCLWDVARNYFHGADFRSLIPEICSIMRYLKRKKVGISVYIKMVLFIFLIGRKALVKKIENLFKQHWEAKNIYIAVKQVDALSNNNLKVRSN